MTWIDKVREYLRSSQTELEKVSWPSRQDTIRYSVLVVISSVVAAAFFTGLDFSLQKAVETLITRRTPQAVEEQAPPAPVTPDIEVVTPSGTDANASGFTVTPLEVNGEKVAPPSNNPTN